MYQINIGYYIQTQVIELSSGPVLTAIGLLPVEGVASFLSFRDRISQMVLYY